LWLYGILGKDEWTVTLGLVPLALGLVLGSVTQVAFGRTDVRRAHRAMSLAFWAVVGLTLAAAAGYWLWVRSASPAEVGVRAVTRDPAGRWIFVEGQNEHSGYYPHAFLIDTTTGRHLARPGPDAFLEPLWGLGMVFSADGRFAALPGTAHGAAALRLFDLGGEAPRVTQVDLESSPPTTWTTAFVLSPSASAVFVTHESGASIYALPSGRRVATTTIPPGWRPAAARFPAEGAARAWLVPSDDGPAARRARAEMRVVDLSADGASSGTTFPTAASLDPMRAWRAILPDPQGRLILTKDSGLRLRDGATGALVASLVEGPVASPMLPGLFLADGRIVVDVSRAGVGRPLEPRLRVFDPAGVALGDIDLPRPPWGLSLGPEVAPGRILVSCFRSPVFSEDTLVVDVARRAVVDTLSGLRPAMGFWGAGPEIPVGARLGTIHFFRDAEDRVVRIDFSTGERKVVAGTGAIVGERISVAR
jgi:hypothetical protein